MNREHPFPRVFRYGVKENNITKVRELWIFYAYIGLSSQQMRIHIHIYYALIEMPAFSPRIIVVRTQLNEVRRLALAHKHETQNFRSSLKTRACIHAVKQDVCIYVCTISHPRSPPLQTPDPACRSFLQYSTRLLINHSSRLECGVN